MNSVERSPAETPDERLLAGRAALERHACGEALELLAAADAEQPLSAGDLDGLADAHAWTGHIEDAIATWERAHAAHLAAGDPSAAARSALLIVRESWGLGRRSSAAGWYRRARRLLEDQEECAVHGYLAMAEWYIAMARDDHNGAVVLGERMLDLGTRFSDPDLQALGLLRSGAALVARGDVEEGLGLLDEATAAALAGDLGKDATFIVYCATVSVCRDLADYGRAGEWALAAKRWCERRSITGFPGVCRIYHAEILRLRGAWDEAEADVRSACEELEQAGLRANAAAGFYELGEIRMRMGDLSSAEDAFCKAHEAGHSPHPGLALVRLTQGHSAEAADGIARALKEEPADRLARARLLAAQVEIAIATGDVQTADAAATELTGIADAFGTDALSAHAKVARAEVALAAGDHGLALQSALDALRVWQELDLPYEAARVRMTAAGALADEGDRDGAVLELRAAEAAFAQLGARLDARRATEALRREGARAPAAAAPSVTRAFMFTDIVKSTDLLAAIGDDAWVSARTWHDGALRDLFVTHGGEEISHAGDGFFVAFSGVSAAIACAVEIQRTLDHQRRQQGFALAVRIGLHAATAARTADGYAGRGVHEAARIGGFAGAAEIVASRALLEQTGAGVRSGKPRLVELKGLDEPIEVVTIEWRT